MELYWIVSSSLDHGECFTIHGVFSSEDKADEYITQRDTGRPGIYYYKDPVKIDDPDAVID